MEERVRHPAKFSQVILDLLEVLVKFFDLQDKYVLDPFSGVGRVNSIGATKSIGNELEVDWASEDNSFRTVQGNALSLPFRDNSFGAIVTSPTYGNRMADCHVAKDVSRRNTYTHAIGHKLHPDNSGSLQWGDKYREFHEQAWVESLRVLEPSGIFILNISDHIRKGAIQQVTAWHRDCLKSLGLTELTEYKLGTLRNRFGSNSDLRLPFESVITFRKDISNKGEEYKC